MSEWISVENSVPDIEDSIYLVYSVSDADYGIGLWYEGRWFFDGPFEHDDVTHWQPLHSRPKDTP